MQRAWNSPRAGPFVRRTCPHKGQRPRSHFWLGHLPGSTNSTPQALHFTVYSSSRTRTPAHARSSTFSGFVLRQRPQEPGAVTDRGALRLIHDPVGALDHYLIPIPLAVLLVGQHKHLGSLDLGDVRLDSVDDSASKLDHEQSCVFVVRGDCGLLLRHGGLLVQARPASGRCPRS